MTFPITAPAGGAYPISAAWGPTSSFANTDQNDTNATGNYAWRGVDTAPTVARVASTGSETYTIVSGSVTTITGTTIDGVSVAVNDPVLLKDCPSSSGAGSVGSSQPTNGLYYVTAVATNISVSRAATMSATSGQANPSGRVIFIRAGTVNALTMWIVSSPANDAAFTYGTTAMAWTNFLLTIKNPTLTTPVINSPTFTGTGVPNAAIQQAGINNVNHTLQSQVVVSGTAYYITNSDLDMPASPLTGMQANKTAFVWDIAMAKTAAGTGTFQIVLYRGTNGSTSDTADVTQTIGTQTAVIDEMTLKIQLVVTTTGGTGAYYWTIIPDNHASVPATPAGFGVPGTGSNAFFNGTVSSVAMNTASLKFGIGFIATTGTPTITVPLVRAVAYNMD